MRTKPIIGTRACVTRVRRSRTRFDATRSRIYVWFTSQNKIRRFRGVWFSTKRNSGFKNGGTRRREFLFLFRFEQRRPTGYGVTPKFDAAKSHFARPSDRVTGRILRVISLWIDSRLINVYRFQTTSHAPVHT